MARKLPAIGAWFWVIKVLTTAMGEVTSDYLVTELHAMTAIALGGVSLAIALALQFAVRSYVAGIYWLAVAMVAVFGTMIADAIHVGLGVPYAVSTLGFGLALVVVFIVWHAREGTLSIHTIDTRSREIFYWATVMATFALGTAAGDLTATTVGIGFFWSGVMFTALIALPALAYRYLGLNEVAAFWIAYVLTRPLGASFADWLGRATDRSGVGLGTGPVGLALTLVIVGCVAYLTVTRKDVATSGAA
jgi:uncharacterized membrane-anchored protein